MKTLIVYDSVFGNTKAIAEAMGRALEATVKSASECSRADMTGVELLIAGSPTRAFRPTKTMARFLSTLPAGSLAGVRAAAFDTRVDIAEVNSGFLEFMVRIFGYAAPHMEKTQRRKGATVAIPAEGFIVQGTEGPLKTGEEGRAVAWARSAGA